MREFVLACVLAFVNYAYPFGRSAPIQAEFLYRAQPLLEWLDLEVQYEDPARAREVGQAYRLIEARMKPRGVTP